MCGINGFNWQDDHLIRRMNEVTKYRGPDGEGFFLDDHVSFGHRRLSIIDLTSSGSQPMFNQDRTLAIIYNGEIYNYRELNEELRAMGHAFQSTSDTETILHAYEAFGMECFSKLNGMWSLCLYDMREMKLVLCRDRYGIKPLYYYQDEKRLIFSSMISAILCHDIPVKANLKTVMEFMAFNLSHHGQETFFENIFSILPGHLMEYDLRTNSSHIRQWYRPSLRPLEDVNDLKISFMESVRYHNVSDVPVGVSLSGGIDSTAITTVLDQYCEDVLQTYSIIVPGSPVDESKYIYEAGRHINSQPFITDTSIDEFMGDLDDFVAAMEEPVASFSVYAEYKIFKMAHQQGTKVLMNGQGGDELFAGYEYYYAYYFYELLKKFRLYTLAKEIILHIKKSRTTFALRMFIFQLLPQKLRNVLWKRLVNPWVNHGLLRATLGDRVDPRWKRMTLRDSLEQTMYLTSIPHLLMWADKSSMRWSVESRVPFLEVGLVEKARSLVSGQLLEDGETKIIFKKAVSEFLPELIRNRKDKIGFQAPPVDEFFRSEPLKSFTQEIFESDSFKQRPYWNWTEVYKTLNDHQAMRINAGTLLGKWLSLELWHRKFIDQRP